VPAVQPYNASAEEPACEFSTAVAEPACNFSAVAAEAEHYGGDDRSRKYTAPPQWTAAN